MQLPEVPQEDKEKIWYLYFEKMFWREQIVKHFDGKYSKATIGRVIDERYR